MLKTSISPYTLLIASHLSGSTTLTLLPKLVPPPPTLALVLRLPTPPLLLLPMFGAVGLPGPALVPFLLHTDVPVPPLLGVLLSSRSLSRSTIVSPLRLTRPPTPAPLDGLRNVSLALSTAGICPTTFESRLTFVAVDPRLLAALSLALTCREIRWSRRRPGPQSQPQSGVGHSPWVSGRDNQVVMQLRWAE